MSWSYIAFDGLWGPRDTEAKAGGQRPADVEGQWSEGPRGLESKSGGLRLAGWEPELEDK